MSVNGRVSSKIQFDERSVHNFGDIITVLRVRPALRKRRLNKVFGITNTVPFGDQMSSGSQLIDNNTGAARQAAYAIIMRSATDRQRQGRHG
jgi:hypothetical protein